MISRSLLNQKRDELLKVAHFYGASNLRIFGSVARNQVSATSDLDLLVDIEQGRSLMDLGGFQYEAQEILGCKVDVFTEKMLRDSVLDSAVREAVKL